MADCRVASAATTGRPPRDLLGGRRRRRDPEGPPLGGGGAPPGRGRRHRRLQRPLLRRAARRGGPPRWAAGLLPEDHGRSRADAAGRSIEGERGARPRPGFHRRVVRRWDPAPGVAALLGHPGAPPHGQLRPHRPRERRPLRRRGRLQRYRPRPLDVAGGGHRRGNRWPFPFGAPRPVR